MVRLTWFGHACFLIEGQGQRIITDPFDSQVGYDIPGVEADIVTVSHEHWDHCAVDTVRGNPTVVRQPGDFEINGISIKGIPTYHDRSQGRERGRNTVYVVGLEGMNVVHLGDLGHLLSEKDIESIGQVDVLLIPVGGTFTIDANDAVKVVERLKPRVVVPMHFKTPHLSFQVAPVEEFIQNFDKVAKRPYLELNATELEGEMKVIVLDYTR